MSTTEFAVTWAYRCPFARNFSEHVLLGLASGAPWDVTWIPFALEQTHVGEGEPDAWDDPSKTPALLSIQAGIAVRDQFPERFPAAHLAIFAARHDNARDLNDPGVLREAVASAGLDPDEVEQVVASKLPAKLLAADHTWAVDTSRVFGVPTFVTDRRAVFVRLMSRPDSPAAASATLERVLAMVEDWQDLNEFKATAIPR